MGKSMMVGQCRQSGGREECLQPLGFMHESLERSQTCQQGPPVALPAPQDLMHSSIRDRQAGGWGGCLGLCLKPEP